MDKAAGQRLAGRRDPRAIVAALDRLPRTGEFAVADEQRRQAEAHLVALATEHYVEDPSSEDPQVLGELRFHRRE